MAVIHSRSPEDFDMTKTKAALLAAGDIAGLLQLNKAEFGDAEMMARGYNAFGDILRTADGADINALWGEVVRAVAERNAKRQRWIELLTRRTTQPSENVLQVGDTDSIRMERASEFGVPQGIRPEIGFIAMSADARWYDIGTKFTFQALADMTASEVQAVTNAALEADNKLMYELTMTQLFNPTNLTFTENGVSRTQFTFWNGDGIAPPSYNGQSFSGSHTHFRISGAAAITSGDLDEIVSDFKSHGLSAETGAQMVLLANPVEAAVINTFRVGTGAAEDFVPAAGARFFTQDHLLGEQPAATWAGYAVKGAYGEMLVIEDSRIPAGYVVGLVSGGENNDRAPLVLREHPQLTGLQTIPGKRDQYPLVDSYFCHYVGVGARMRSAALVMQIKASGSYAAPTSLTV